MLVRPYIRSRLHDNHQTLDLIAVASVQQEMNSLALTSSGVTGHLGDHLAIDGTKSINICHSTAPQL
jgi:hypothetical protein